MTASERRAVLPILRNVALGIIFARDVTLAGTLMRRFDRKPSIKKRAAKKERKQKKIRERQSHGEETAAIRAAVFARAGHICEASRCLAIASDLDHFYGRARVPQSVENCWALCAGHHRLKTENDPTREWWDAAFVLHCQRFGYPYFPRLAKARPSTARNLKGDLP